MPHIREQLRTKAKAIIEAAINRPAHINRLYTIDSNRLPCAIITTDSDDVEQYSTNRNRQNRLIDLTVRVYAKSLENADNEVDDLCASIETAFINDTSISANQLILQSTQIDIFGDGEQPIAMATMKYRAAFLNVTSPTQTI